MIKTLYIEPGLYLSLITGKDKDAFLLGEESAVLLHCEERRDDGTGTGDKGQVAGGRDGLSWEMKLTA